ncbi:MAG TPA: maleylpyruvate isomerase family mycothiol-dependent enzyme, partial [Acidimicrobiales bacterium]
MDPAVAALAEQQVSTKSLLEGLTTGDWRLPTRCEGWTIADVVLHLAQSDEMAAASLQGVLPTGDDTSIAGWGGGSSVDESVALMVDGERGATCSDLLSRWISAADHLTGLLDGMDLSTRVRWVAGDLSARTLAATRLSETWIHTGDVAA